MTAGSLKGRLKAMQWIIVRSVDCSSFEGEVEGNAVDHCEVSSLKGEVEGNAVDHGEIS